MPKLSRLEVLNRTFRDNYGSKAVTTETGYASFDRRRTNSAAQTTDVMGAILQNESAIPFEIPTRDIATSYLVQEIYAVSSIFNRAVEQLAGDAAQDSQADIQPHTIIINGESESREEKIFKVLDSGFRKLGLGINTYMRNRRCLKSGMAIGQPVFEYNGRWYMTKVKLMPTWEMIKVDHKNNLWKQVRKDGFGEKILGSWDIPNFLATSTYLEDDNFPYGTPIAALVLTDYRLMIMAIEDTAISGRTRAPRRLVHYYGEEGRVASPEQLQAYKKLVSANPMSVVSNYFLRNGIEKIDQLQGDAQGTEALMRVCEFYQNNMRRALGLSVNSEKASGRGLEEVDAQYARNINTLRMIDFKFIKNIGDKLLLLEGYSDIDWSTQIPSLGMTEASRATMASEELELGHSGMQMYCAERGIKNITAHKADIEQTLKWRKEMNDKYGMKPPVDSQEIMQKRKDDKKTESPAKGADAQKGRARRKKQRDAGRVPTGV